MRLRALVVCLLLAGCGGGGEGDAQPVDPSSPHVKETSAPLEAANTVLTIQYGQHFPNGKAAMEYLTGPEGMWREVEAPEYAWNYYQDCASAAHPFDRNALINAADGTRFFTAPDANCNIFLDTDGDGVVEPRSGAHAFFEHNGRGVDGAQRDTPFTNFWFDDNWLARYATDAYGYPSPDGLGGDPAAIRWSVLSGQLDTAIFYGHDNFDRLALDGVYYLVAGKRALALAKWQRILERSGSVYNPDNQRYEYVNIDTNYHLALFGLLTAMLLDTARRDEASYDDLVQHWVATRSNMLSRQERRDGMLLGWRSGQSKLGSLMNTETIALNALALGTGALHVFEAGEPPLGSEARGYLRRPHNVLSAVLDSSQPGYMTQGPAAESYGAGNYTVEFFVRASAAAGDVATLDVIDAVTREVLVTRTVSSTDLRSDNRWSQMILPVRLSERRALEFRTYWLGTGNLDVAAIRVRRPMG